MNDDTLMIIGSLDQPIQTDDGWALNRIDEIIERSVQEHNAYIALNAGQQLRSIIKTSGLSLAKLLFLMKKNWDQYDMADEFNDVAYEYIGIEKVTVDRYIDVWNMLTNNSIPEQFREGIQQRNIKDNIPIAHALEDHEISDDIWQKLVEAPDINTVSKIIREEVTHQPPKKGSLQLYMDRTGTIWAFYNDERYFVGSLEVDADEEAVQKAIKRIISGGGILEQ